MNEGTPLGIPSFFMLSGLLPAVIIQEGEGDIVTGDLAGFLREIPADADDIPGVPRRPSEPGQGFPS